MTESNRYHGLNNYCTNTVRVVAAIPAYNTQCTIADIVTRAKRYADEVIVIDDGSTDNTSNSARGAGAKVVSHKVNKGYGEAINSCFAEAKANKAAILVIIDGDGQHNPDEIPLVLKPIFEDAADMVIGSRFLNKYNKIPSYRKIGIVIINYLWNFGSYMKVSDTQSGFRAYNSLILSNSKFSEKGMSISIEILEKARGNRLKIKEVPITCSYENNNSNPSVQAFLHGFGVATSVLRIRLKNMFNKNS